jgi:hypothetical protein
MRLFSNTVSGIILWFVLHAPAGAHDGHGLFGSHWHATDASGFIVAIALAVALWAIGRRK